MNPTIFVISDQNCILKSTILTWDKCKCLERDTPKRYLTTKEIRCSDYPNIRQPKFEFIWKRNTWIPNSSEYRTVWVSSIQMAKSRDLATIQIPYILDHKQAFFQSSFENIIWLLDHLTTKHKSTIEFQTSPVFRWLPYLNCLQIMWPFWRF